MREGEREEKEGGGKREHKKVNYGETVVIQVKNERRNFKNVRREGKKTILGRGQSIGGKRETSQPLIYRLLASPSEL